MSFNPSVPQLSTPKPIVQQQFLNNWQAIQQVFNNNHMPLNDPQEGMHKVMTMSYQTMDPTTNSTQIGLYTKLTGANNAPNLFFAPDSAQTPIQLTWDSINTTKGQARQYSFMAGPFVIYGGLVNGVTSGQTITLSPTTTLLYVGVNLVVEKASGAGFQTVIPTTLAGSTFTIFIPATSGSPIYNLYYLAIGKP